ncbi:MAG: Ig-like domain-containing protein, partial [Rariglobus sp.]
LEDTTNVITLAASAVSDSAGNANSATASSANYAVDTLRPTATITLNDSALKVGETATVTITFNEIVSGLTTGDFTVEGGALSGLSSSDGGKTYTATFTPSSSLEDTTNVITLAASAVSDSAGNANSATASSANYAVDTLRPAAPTVTPRLTNDTTPTVTGTFDNADSTIVSVVINGVTYTPGDGNLSVSGNTWSVTIPAPNALSENTYEVAVTAKDTAGNTSTDTSSTELVIDTTRPTLEITAPSFNYLTSPSTTVTFTFDEAVTAFDSSDVATVGGTLSNFTQVNDHTWTATFTATTGNGAYSVTVANNTYTDLATNNGFGDNAALSDASIKTVSFVDSFVGGIEFSTSSGLSGLSDADGNFSYRDGDTITFKIGNITLGVFDSTAIQGDYLFIQDIAGVGLNDLNSMYVENMAILLQLLDSDHNVDNGITISQLIRDAADQVSAFDLSLSDKQQLSDVLAELRDIDTLIPLFTADTELSEDGLNVFETLAMAHVKSVIESLAGTRLPAEFDARLVDAIDVNAAVITYDFTSGVITFSNADLLANSHGRQVHTGNLIVSEVAISAAYAGFGDFVNNGDGTYTFTLHEGVTPYDIENFSVDYKVQDWTRDTAVTSSGLDTNKSHLSWTLDTPLDVNGNVPEDVGYIQLTIKSALTFTEDKELTFSFTSERLSTESVQFAEFGDDFLIPFEYSNDGGATWQLMSAFKITLAAGNDTLLVRVPIFDDASQERALELFDGTIKGDAFYDEKVQFNIADNDGPSEVPLMRIDFVYSVENQGTVSYTVRLDRPSNQTITVDYNTQDFGAVAGVDYEATSGMLIFCPGETEKTITVTLHDDLTPEQLEFAIMNLRNATNAAIADMQGSLRIFDNDIEPRTATVSAPVVTESAANLVFTITLDQPFTSAALLDVGIETSMAEGTYGPYEYSLNGGRTWDFFNPVANSGSTTAGHLIVQPDVTEVLVRVSVSDPDTIPEADDTFKFTVSGNYAITGTADATALLRNDDGSAVTLNPVTPDNILSFAESGLPVIPVTGSVIGDAREGDTVTVVVNGHTYTGTLGADLTFSIDVTTTDLLTDPLVEARFTSTGPDEVERTVTAERPVTLDLIATRPTVDPYTGSDSTPVLTGDANLDEGESLTVTVNGVTYTQGDGHLTVADGRWTLVIPPENPLPAGRLSVTATVTDAVGNTATDTSSDELFIAGTPPPPPPTPLPTRDQVLGVHIPDPFGPTGLPGHAPDWVPPVFNQERSFSFGFNREDYEFLGLGRDFQQDLAMTERGFKVIVIPADIPNLLLYRGVPDSYIESNNPFSFTIPVDAFVHTQADAQVVLNATLTDGSALPDWLIFDRVTGTFEGVPPKSFTGELRVKVVARDSMGLQTEAIFRLFIGVPKPTAALQSRTGFTAQLRQFDYLPASSHRLELASR